ncbi:DUF1516 family protein [Companilactobacillus sp. HBUAS59544]|uniref:DUF1516 family protein n=1 Tax=Companilactobacillus sp. HBUAS59544 TaxID=3109363 RepID=UPI002FF0D77C
MIWLWTHLLTWIVMAIMILLAIFTSTHTKIYEMITRLAYVVIIVTGIKLGIRAWSVEPTLLIIKILVALAFIALVEIAFAKKDQKKLSNSLIVTVIVLCIIVAVLGFFLAGWYPFVRH